MRAVPERVAHRHPVDLRRERTEAFFVGHVLGGQGHRQIGAAVITVLEHNDGRALGRVPGDLHRVLHGLGSGVEQCAALGVVTGRQSVERFTHIHVALIWRDHEAGVREVVGLRGDRVGDHRVGVTDGGHRDTRTHIDQVVAVHVDEHTTTGTLDEDRQPNTDPGGDRLGLLG